MATPFTIRRRTDTYLRFGDLAVQRLNAGTRFERFFRIQRHTILSFLWPSIVITAVLTGMPVLSGTRALLSVLTFVFAALAVLTGIRLTIAKGTARDAYVQCGIVLVNCAAVAVIGYHHTSDEGIYLHLLVPVAAIFALSIVAAAAITPWCFETYVQLSTYPEYVRRTEFFQRRPKVDALDLWGWLRGFFLPLIRAPRLVYLPALAAVLPPREYVYWAALAGLLLAWLILGMAELDERLDQILRQSTNRLFQNGALFISLLVIALGTCRVFDVSYVSTILDTAAGLEIAVYLIFVYAAVWWQDYWIDRLVGQQVLRIAGGSALRDDEIGFDYPVQGDHLDRVPADNRRIQVHGIGRFLILRPDSFDHSNAGEPPPFWIKDKFPAFHTWTYSDFFTHVASHVYPESPERLLVPSPQKIRLRVLQHAVVVRAVTVAALVLGALWLSKGPQLPSATASTGVLLSVDLSLLLRNHPADRPAILVAASGGGTRAALFTATVLSGISRHVQPTDVLLGSGVSGGGASLAWFAANRRSVDWDAYFTAMKQPFIQDVLERSSEWRMVAGNRLGVLLDESFERRWNLPEKRSLLRHISDMGLIFNTTIAGSGPEPAQGKTGVYGTELAGGRLIITNLDMSGVFDKANMDYGAPEPLPVIIRDAGFYLTTASALNANFPPVFSNAPIQVDETKRYWVTDGGAADNRGLEMLLYSLRHALEKEPSLRQRRIIVLVVDAGAAPGDFNVGDRGLGSAIGSGAQFAMHLSAELKRSLGEADVELRYLPMPHLLRASGSFGTHWMLQSTIAVDHNGHRASISGDETIAILRDLYAGKSAQLSEKARLVRGWIEQSKEYCENWTKTVALLESR